MGQDVGVLLSVENHNIHHADYSLNFPLLSGFSAPAFNWVSEVLLSPRNTAWMGLFLGYSLGVPFGMYYVPRRYLSTTSMGEPVEIVRDERDAPAEPGCRLNWRDPKMLVRIGSVLACLAVVHQTLSKYGACLFALHPIGMAFGCILFMSEGLLAYHHNPASLTSERDAESQCERLEPHHRYSKLESRKWHTKCMPLASVCMLMAMVGVLLAVAVQVIVGVLKVLNPTGNRHKWHGTFGEMLYVGCVVTAAFGAAEAFGASFASAMLIFLFAVVGGMTMYLRSHLVRPHFDNHISATNSVELVRYEQVTKDNED